MSLRKNGEIKPLEEDVVSAIATGGTGAERRDAVLSAATMLPPVLSLTAHATLSCSIHFQLLFSIIIVNLFTSVSPNRYGTMFMRWQLRKSLDENDEDAEQLLPSQEKSIIHPQSQKPSRSNTLRLWYIIPGAFVAISYLFLLVQYWKHNSSRPCQLGTESVSLFQNMYRASLADFS